MLKFLEFFFKKKEIIFWILNIYIMFDVVSKMINQLIETLVLKLLLYFKMTFVNIEYVGPHLKIKIKPCSFWFL